MKKELKNIRCGKHVSLEMLKGEKIPFDEYDTKALPKQVQAVLALYDKLLQSIYQLSACILDGRDADAAPIRLQCLSILKTLDVGLELKGDLAQNLHTLYGHCLRRLTAHPGYTELEAIDSVRMVIARIRDVYLKVSKKEIPKKTLLKSRLKTKNSEESNNVD